MCQVRQRKRRVKDIAVLFEDDSLIALSKPAFLVVNRSETTRQPTLQDWLEDYLKLPDRGIGGRAGIVHRLDKETSGVILVAKTEEAFVHLQAQFKERQIEKKYLALVHGKVEPKEGVIRASISRSPFDRKKFGVYLGGREAETGYRVKGYYQKDKEPFSLVELTPKTGRTHQIRVHLKYLGYPVVGDDTYAGRKTARKDRVWCPHQFLHAAVISFIHPKTGKSLTLEAPLPNDLKKALTFLSQL